MKRHSLEMAETANDDHLGFVQEGSVYYYLRPRRNLLASCAGICRQASHAGKRNASRVKPGGAENMRYKTPPLWLSFSTAHRRDCVSIPATLSEALIRLRLVYPLASFDVSGQWPVYLAAAWPNEDSSICRVFIHPPCKD